jgi:hypothetical protein
LPHATIEYILPLINRIKDVTIFGIQLIHK